MSLPAAERTAQIIAAGVAWVGEKQDLAMPASRQAFSQLGLLLQNFSNIPVVLRNNTADRFFTVPIRNELKTRLDLYYKKAKCSLMSLMYPNVAFTHYQFNIMSPDIAKCNANLSQDYGYYCSILFSEKIEDW